MTPMTISSSPDTADRPKEQNMTRKSRATAGYQRAAIAEEAARLIQEHGITDFRNAKDKAIQNLGIGKSAPLPGNAEIERALAARNRIFRSDDHPQLLQQLRHAALRVMEQLDPFQPRLAGPVLSGHATEHSPIDLHLFSDSAEEVGSNLEAYGFRSRSTLSRHRLRRDVPEQFPAYRFFAGEFEFAATVFPERYRGHPPISPVDGKPMRRISRQDVYALLDYPPGR